MSADLRQQVRSRRIERSKDQGVVMQSERFKSWIGWAAEEQSGDTCGVLEQL